MTRGTVEAGLRAMMRCLFLLCHAYPIYTHNTPSCLSSCEVASGAFCCPKAEDVRRKTRFQALATGLALDSGALSALHREKKKADHTLHHHMLRGGAADGARWGVAFGTSLSITGTCKVVCSLDSKIASAPSQESLR